MSTPVTYVGTQYNVPAYQDTGYAQGSGNLSSYLIALATGSLTRSGGTFTLTADANFGANFGLKSLYYKSRNANVASTGIVRLGSAEIIAWRDNANANDLELTTNASDQLTYNGLVIATSTGALVGTTLTLSATSNQMVIGTTNTSTISFTAPAASRVYTVPDAGGAASFILSAGAQTITGAKTFADQTLLLQETGSTDVITINVAALAASRAYTMPDAGGAASFVMTAGAQSIGGVKTFTSNPLVSFSSSGAVVSLSIVNGSNTASSDAVGIISVAGTSAGDAYSNWVVSGTTNWSLGIDNSDSDALCLTAASTLNGTNIIRATTAGQINQPLQPCFNAYVGATVSNVTGDGTVYTIIFDTALFDVGSNFNTGTGTFTAPVTGKYLLMTMIQLVQLTVVTHTTVVARIVTTAFPYYSLFDVTAGTALGWMIPICVVANMTAGDTATVTIEVDGASKVVDVVGTGSQARTYFSGSLIN